MRYLSVCSGIEAASVAWEKLGWKPLAFSEIEPFPSAVLKHHWPEVPNLGDMTKYEEWKFEESVDVLVGGTPCQAFSVAGVRKGLDDPRGGLTLTYVKMADYFNPKWVIWENVPGVFTSKDNAFGCFLGSLSGEECELKPSGKKWSNSGCVYGPKRSVAWRCFDAQYFGLAQRRKRVFVVACPPDQGDPSALLFEFEGLRRDSPPSRKAGETTSTELAGCLRSGGKGGTPSSRGEHIVASYWNDPTVPCDTLLARDYKGVGNQDLTTGRLLVSEAIPIHDQATRYSGKHGDKSDGKGNGLGIGKPGDPCPTLTKGDKHAVLYENHPNDSRVTGPLEIAPSCVSRYGTGGGNLPLVQAFDAYNQSVSDVSQSISSAASDINHTGGVLDTRVRAAVRRIMPTECEKLQGFPVDHTRIPWRKKSAKDCPDGKRYKALGNSMAVPCMQWIGNRIDQYVKGNK
jgi:DNA (cytosine-5)-methyltransferase 1